MRRDRFTMMIAMMEVLEKPIIITHIMNKANVNCSTVKQELENLITKNLATMIMPPKKPFQQCNNENINRFHYVLTPEGTEVLNSLLKARTLLMEPS